MIKFLRCVIFGHEYRTSSVSSVGPHPESILNKSGGTPITLSRALLGYTETIRTCRRCGKMETITTLGI